MIHLVHYIECRNLLNRKPLFILNEEMEEVGEVKYLKPKDEFNMLCTHSETGFKYYVKTNPLKLKPKHIILNEGKEPLAKVSVGVKIIHSIIEADNYYFVKSAFWKIKYQVYNNRVVMANLEVVRINKKRYFKITTKENEFVLSLSLFLLAQAVRHKAIIN